MANFDDIFTAPAEQKKEQNEQKKPRRNIMKQSVLKNYHYNYWIYTCFKMSR